MAGLRLVRALWPAGDAGLPGLSWAQALAAQQCPLLRPFRLSFVSQPVQSCWHGLSTAAFTPQHADGATHVSTAAGEPSTATRPAYTPTASGPESAAAAASAGGAAPAVEAASSTQGAGAPGDQQQQHQQQEEVQGKPDLVEKFLSAELIASSGTQRRLARQEVLRDFQRHPADVGSPQVTVALWTHRIRELVPHFDANRKRLHPMRQLELMVNKRRRLLTWLRRADFESYAYTINKLGLQDIYSHTGSADRYREGLRHEDTPLDGDAVNRLRFSFHSKYKQKKTSLWKRLRPQLVSEDPVLAEADRQQAAASKQQQREQRRQASQQV